MKTELREYLLRLATAVCDGDGQALVLVGMFRPSMIELVDALEGEPGSGGHTVQLKLQRALALHDARPVRPGFSPGFVEASGPGS